MRGSSAKAAVLITIALASAAARAATPLAEERLALLAESDATAAERVARLWRLAELEERADNPDLAVAAAKRAVRAAGVAAAIDGLSGGGPDAPAAFDATLRRGLEVGERLGDPELVLEMIAWRPELAKAHVEAVRQAILLRSYSVAVGLREGLVATLGADPAWHVYLTSEWSRPEPLPDAALEPLGALGAKILRQRLFVALDAGDLGAARGLVDRLERVDRFDVRARVTRHLLDEIAAGATLTAADVAAVVEGAAGTRHAGATLKLDRLVKARPAASGLALSLAYQLWTLHLSVESRRVAAHVAGDPRATAEQRLTAAELVALAALEGGDEAAFVGWERRAGAERSLALAQEVLDRQADRWNDHHGLPSPAKRLALRAAFAQPFGPTTRDLQLGWSEDTALVSDDEDLRARATRVLALSAPGHARLIASCRRMTLAADECQARLRLLDSLADRDDDDDDDDDGGPARVADPADVIDRVPELPADGLLALARAPAKKLAALGPRLARLRTERYAGTVGLSELELAVQLARGETANARATLARVGASLPRGDRVAFALRLSPVLATRAPKGHAPLAKDDEAAPGDAREPATLFDLPRAAESDVIRKKASPPAETDAVEPEDEPDTGPEAPARRLAEIFMGRWRAERALKRLPPTWRRLDGVAGVETAGWVWVVARDARSAALAREARARVLKLAARGDVATRIEAELALERGQPAPALELARRLWTMEPSSSVAEELFLRAWLRGLGAAALPGGARAWLPRLGSLGGSMRLTRAGRAVELGLAKTGADLLALDDARDDQEKLLAFSPDVIPASFVTWWVQDQYGKRPAADVPALAKRLLDYLARATPAPANETIVGLTALEIWSQFLAGDSRAATAVLRRPKAPRGTPFRDVATFAHADLRLVELILAVSEPLDTAFRQRVFSLLTGHGKAGDLADDLGKRADAARAKEDAARFREVACLASSHGRRVAPTLAICRRAWDAGARSPFVAEAIADTLVNDAAASRRDGFDGAAFFSEAHAALHPAPPGLSHDEATWLAELRRTREAAALEASALADGFDRQLSRVPHVIDWSRTQPLLAEVEVTLTHYSADERDSSLGLVALLGGDPEAGELYFRAAAQSFKGETALNDTQKETRSRSYVFLDLIEVARADVRRNRLDAQALADSVESMVHKDIMTLLPSLRRRYPSSEYLALLAADSSPARPATADPIVQQLSKEFPTNPMVARISFAALVLAKRFPEATAVLDRARKAHPDDPLLADLTAPTAAAANGPPPAWAATAPAFTEALAKADPTPLAAVEPRYEDWASGHLDAYVPKAFEHDATQEFGFLHDGVRLLALRVPRVTHCQPAACLEELASVLEKQGLVELWTRPVWLPLGEAHEGMFRGPVGVVVVAAIPSGPDVIYVSTGGPADKLRDALPAARLFRESMRDPDAALGKARTALLTRNLWVERGPVDLRARLRPLDGAGKGCPLAAEALPAGHAVTSSALLARLYLATPRREERVRLLACTSGERETSAALGLAALWDGPDEAAAFGRAVVARRGAAAAELLGNGLDLTNEHAARDDLLDGREELLAGTLQALEALPAVERGKLVARFRASDEPRLRALALASVHWSPDALAADAQEKILLEGAEEDTLMLLAALPPTLAAPLVAAARKRLDGLAAPLAHERLRLAMALALKLARGLDAVDGPRLARVRQALRGADDLDEDLAQPARRAIGAHAADRLGEKADLETQAVLARWRQTAAAENLRATPISLDLPLSSRLPDHGWSFFAIRQPRAFVASLSDTVRGASDAPADRSAPGRLLLGRSLEAVGSERLSTSGLDVDQPLECALGSGAHDTWICTGRLSDEAAWRHRLSEGAPRDSGLMLPEVIGSFGTALPTLGIFLPVMVPEPAAKHGAPGGGGGGGKSALVAEHVRDRRSIAGLDVWRDTDVRVSGDHTLATRETLSLVAGQRVWLFSDEQTLHLWLAMSPRTASDPGAAATATRQPGALVAFWPAGEDNDVPGGFTLDLDATSEGLHIRSRSLSSTAPADPGALAARLPPGAALRFAAANVDALPVMSFRGPGKTSVGEDGPPAWLWGAGTGVAFGWYPGEGAKPEQWVTAVRWEPGIQSAWRARHLPEPTERPAAARTWSFARARDVLVVSSDRGLLDASLAAKPAAARGGAVSAETQGAALTKLLERRAARAPKGTEAAQGLQSWALLTSVLASIETTAHVEDRSVVSETWLRPSARAGSRDRSSVDALLGSHRLKNSLRLPVDVDDERAERPVTFVVRGSRPDEIRRVFPGSDRLSVSDAGPGLERLRILPAPLARKGAPLPENERRLYLGENGPPAPAMRATARDIVAGLTTPWDRARAIVAWVHREMTYEITPSAIDDVTLLDRRHGDCTEYAQLTIALLRALDVPARPRNGLLASGRSLVAHAWVEFHDGQAWHELDPTMGRTSVDAAYVDASIVDLLPLLTDARLSVTGVE